MAVALIDVVSIRLTNTPGQLDCVIKVDAGDGEEEWPFFYVEEDAAPVTLAIRQWMIDHPDFPILPANGG